MAVVEEKGSREITHNAGGWFGKRLYRVDTHDGSLAVQDAECPVLGESFPNYPFVFCKDVSITYRDTQHCTIEATYDNVYDIETAPHADGDVTEEWTVGTRTEKAYYDLDGIPIGSMGEGVDVLVPYASLVVNTWRDTSRMMSITDLCVLVGSVNSTTFKGATANSMLCSSASVRREGERLYNVQFLFGHNGSSSGWQYEWKTFRWQPGDWTAGVFVPSRTGMEKAKVYYGDPIVSRIYRANEFAVIWP